MVHCLPHLWMLVFTHAHNNPFFKCVIDLIIRDFIHISCKQKEISCCSHFCRCNKIFWPQCRVLLCFNLHFAHSHILHFASFCCSHSQLSFWCKLKRLFFSVEQQLLVKQVLLFKSLYDYIQRHHTMFNFSGRVKFPKQKRSTDNTHQPQQTDIHDPCGNRAHKTSKRAT